MTTGRHRLVIVTIFAAAWRGRWVLVGGQFWVGSFFIFLNNDGIGTSRFTNMLASERVR
jgi:hypothetical protein